MARDTVKPKTTVVWDQSLVEGEKLRIKQELDLVGDPKKDGEKRLKAIFSRLEALESDDSDLGRLRRYIYAMSALVQHERKGGLSERDITHLVTLAYAILKAQGIKPKVSRLASLYADVHLIKSQIFRKAGAPWKAAWEQQVALQISGKATTGGEGFQLLGMANRSLRLGHAPLAIQQFRQAEAAGLPDAYVGRGRLGLAHALWLSGRSDEAAQVAGDALKLPDLGEELTQELHWTALAREAPKTLDLSRMLKETRAGGQYQVATYVIETTLWACALEKRDYLERLPKLANMRRNKTVRPQRQGLWYKCGVALQECYDHDIPLPFRIKTLGAVLEARAQLLTVDKELLLLAAAARFLARAKAFELAALVYSEYRALGRRLTDGGSPDALGVMGDFDGRAWLEPYYPPKSA